MNSMIAFRERYLHIADAQALPMFKWGCPMFKERQYFLKTLLVTVLIII